MALITNTSNDNDIDHADAIDPDDHVPTRQEAKSKQEVLAKDNGKKLSLAEKLKSKNADESLDEKPAVSASPANGANIPVENKAQSTELAPNPVVDTDQKIRAALVGAQENLLSQVRQMMDQANEASKVASLLEMAKRMIEAIIRMIESMLQRFGFIKGKKEGEERQDGDQSRDQEAPKSQPQGRAAGQGETTKNVEIAKVNATNAQPEADGRPLNAPSNSPQGEIPAGPAVEPEVANRLEQAEALINSIIGPAGDMLSKFLSDPFVQRHAERGDKPATVSALCDRALEVCRQDLASASAMLRELMADISGTDAQRIGMRPREAAQLILEGGIDPALVNPKLKSKATLLIREYGPLADRLGAIRQAVGIIVADTVSQAEDEGAAATEILHKTLESLKTKLKTLGGGDDLAIARLGLNESFRAVGTAHIGMVEQGDAGDAELMTSEVAAEVTADSASSPTIVEVATAQVDATPGTDPEMVQVQEQSQNKPADPVSDPVASNVRYLIAANDVDFMADETDVATDSSNPESHVDRDRPRG